VAEYWQTTSSDEGHNRPMPPPLLSFCGSFNGYYMSMQQDIYHCAFFEEGGRVMHPLHISTCAHVKMDVFSVYNAVGHIPVVHTLPDGEAVLGVTSLGDEFYVLRWKEHDQVEVYDVINYRLLRHLTVPDIHRGFDMTSCEHYHCVYISDHIAECIHRLVTQGAVTQWAVNDEPKGLSVNAAHNVLVTCCRVRKIKEFSSHGDLLRELTLPGDVIHPLHAIQARNGEFIVCHGDPDDAVHRVRKRSARSLRGDLLCELPLPGGIHQLHTIQAHGDPDDAVHRVCKISADGRHVIKSHGGQPGSDIGKYHGPIHLAVDNNEFVFVAELNSRRVTLLSPTLDYIRQVVSSDDLKGGPDRLCLDIHKRRLYVVENGLGEGCVVVFSV